MSRTFKTVLAVIVILIIGLVGFQLGRPLLEKLFPPLPAAQPVTQARWLDQNWSEADRYWFHHASQGTSTLPIPYRWFIALQAPTFSLLSPAPLLSSDGYMRKLGFIPSPRGGQNWREGGFEKQPDAAQFAAWGDGPIEAANPGGLPVGFAVTKSYADPTTGRILPDQIGLTCAACHTGHLDYKGVSLRIDGGNSAASLGKLTDALGASLALTDLMPWRFKAFADRVLGPGASDADRAKLHAELKATLDVLKAAAAATASVTKSDVEEGYNRLDALNRIGNQVFFTDLVPGKSTFDPKGNFAALTAPVKFPHLWDSPWFVWAQYDGSIMQPIVRNAGEAMGVAAKVNMTAPDKGGGLWASSVDFGHLVGFEHMLAGPNPLASNGHGGVQGFSGLRAPKWPQDVLGAIDPALAARGRAVYQERCQGCHLPPVSDPSQGLYDPRHWTTKAADGRAFLNVPLIPQSEVGTDPAQAQILINRKVSTPAGLGVEQGVVEGDMLCFDKPSAKASDSSFGGALAFAVQQTVNRRFGANADQMAGREGRRNCIQAKAVYKARPLDGIWATPPYLHNGSVPSLYALLGADPARDRPTTFCLGNRQYDPKVVGLDVSACPSGTFRFDAGVAGNSNRGHEFRGDGTGAGVIGKALSEADRLAVIEFLKTL